MDISSTLDLFAIDKSDPLPLYHQLQRKIRAAIEKGLITPGEKLPSISALAKSCGMSNATVVQALAPLGREGLIISRRGFGNVVAAAKAKTTEVVIHFPFKNLQVGKGSFFYQIVEGVMEGYNDAARRITFSHYDHSPLSAQELLEVCRARNADGMVVYRPEGAIEEAIKTVARRLPTVTLFHPVKNSLGDCVMPDPAAPLRNLLEEYIERGERKFTYIGPAHLLEKDHADSPYYKLYQEFVRLMDEAGIEPDIRLSHPDGSYAEKNECKRVAQKMPDDAIALASSPDIAEAGLDAGVRSRFITYTESAASREKISGRADILYMGLELMSLRAVELLKARLFEPNAPQRIMSVEPVIHKMK